MSPLSPCSLSAVAFDHDGTLVNSLAAVVAATNAALVEHGHAEQAADIIISNMFRATDPRMGFHAGVSDKAEQTRMSATFYRHARILAPVQCSLYPGVIPLLERLTQRRIPLAVVSNNEGVVIRRVMKQLGVLDHFSAALGEEDFATPKPHPSGLLRACELLHSTPTTTVFVGDSHPDCDAAHAAGMLAIGVTWGIHPRSEMQHFGCDYLVDTPEQLWGLLEPALKKTGI